MQFCINILLTSLLNFTRLRKYHPIVINITILFFGKIFYVKLHFSIYVYRCICVQIARIVSRKPNFSTFVVYCDVGVWHYYNHYIVLTNIQQQHLMLNQIEIKWVKEKRDLVF